MSIKAKAGDYVVRTLFEQVEWQEWRDKTNNRPVRVDEVKTKPNGTVVYSTPEVLWKHLNDPWWDAQGFGGKVVPPKFDDADEGTGQPDDTEGIKTDVQGTGGKGKPQDGPEGDEQGEGDRPKGGDGEGDESKQDKSDVDDKDKQQQNQSSQPPPPPPDIPVGDLLTLEQVKDIRELVEKARKDNPQWTDGFQAMCDLVLKGCESVWQKQQECTQKKEAK